MTSDMSQIKSIDSFCCKPALSKCYKGKIGLVAVKDIPSQTKVIDRPCYLGRWYYTEQLKGSIDEETLCSLQELYKNKRLFMSDKNRTYTFVPQLPIHAYHADMFLNSASGKPANVVCKSDGYFTVKEIKAGEELLLLKYV